MKFLLIPLIAIAALSGCATDISSQTYPVGSVGKMNKTSRAVIISAREVDIAGKQTLGTVSGATVGAVVGSAAGGRNERGNIVGAIGGALLGGALGAFSESAITKQKAIEYIVETEGGNTMTIIQGDQTPFPPGQNVLVIHDTPLRLIVDPRTPAQTERLRPTYRTPSADIL